MACIDPPPSCDLVTSSGCLLLPNSTFDVKLLSHCRVAGSSFGLVRPLSLLIRGPTGLTNPVFVAVTRLYAVGKADRWRRVSVVVLCLCLDVHSPTHPHTHTHVHTQTQEIELAVCCKWNITSSGFLTEFDFRGASYYLSQCIPAALAGGRGLDMPVGGVRRQQRDVRLPLAYEEQLMSYPAGRGAGGVGDLYYQSDDWGGRGLEQALEQLVERSKRREQLEEEEQQRTGRFHEQLFVSLEPKSKLTNHMCRQPTWQQCSAS